MTNITKSVLYTGVTNNLARRINEHREKRGSAFTSRYNVTRLVFYESFSRIIDAIAAEKKIKAGSREKKKKLIESMNPEWKDLYDESLGLDCRVAALLAMTWREIMAHNTITQTRCFCGRLSII